MAIGDVRPALLGEFDHTTVRIDDFGSYGIRHRDGALLEDRLGDDVGGVASDRRGDVGVEIQRDADGGVAEALADDLWMNACLQREGGVGRAL
jgi:hypothetical protein